jgi:hypothetical protein
MIMKYLKKTVFYNCIFLLFLAICCKSINSGNKLANNRTESDTAYFVNGIHGDDKNSGTALEPVKTISEINRRLQKKALSVYFAGGQIFDGTLILRNIEGTKTHPLVISTGDEVRAVIKGGNNEAVHIENCRYVLLKYLDIIGNGRKGGNSTNGLAIAGSDNCSVQYINAKGFQKSGVDVYNCSETEVKNVIATDNGFSGINVMGSERTKSRRIIIRNCKAENNPGDPTILDNHSGNGILVGVSDSVVIDHCTATNNGWDMPRKGNGPVGIWAWESNRVVIQYCISYRNKTSENASDGGGFDLDGGVTNSIIQYCLSYENQGAGYGLFQYSGASDWSNNAVRFCVSINDATTTKGAGSIFIWNGSDDSNQMINCLVYNNVFYNTTSPVISFEKASAHKDFRFLNNIFLGVDQVILGNISGSTFLGNDWWNTGRAIKFPGFDNVNEWAKATGQEMLNGKMAGMQVDPLLKGPSATDITDPWQLDKLEGFVLNMNSPLKNRGVDLKSVLGIDLPLTDFYGNEIHDGNVNEPGIFQIQK